ncbi:MAG: copper resistance protein CopC [Ilumatobacteraceae bacterium]
MSRPRRRLRRRLGIAVGIAALAFATSPGRAAAHAGLESSIPAASATLEETPSDIVLDFDEPIEASISTIELFDADAHRIEIGEPEASVGDDSVVLAPLPDLDDGIYAVVWRIGSADGHIVDGAFSFRIGTGGSGDAGDLIDQVRGGARAAPSVDRAADVARLLGFVGLTALIGSGLFALMSPHSLVQRRSTRLLIVGGWVLLVAGTFGSFGLYGAEAVAGDVGDAFSPEVWRQVAETRNGWLLLVRSGLVVVIGAVMWLGMRRPSLRTTSWWQASAVALGVAIVLTYPSAGHPSAESPRSLWVLVDGVHLGAVTVWLGGLLLFATGGSVWFSDDGERTVRRFSNVATVLVPVAVVSGSVQMFKLGGDLDDFTETGWGRTLLAKLAIVVVLLAIAGVSRWLLANVGVASVRRTVMAEAGFGIVVLAVAASLVSQPPQPIDQASVFSASLAQGGVLVDVTLTPGRVGANELHLVVTSPGGSLTPVSDASARMELPSRSIPTTPVTIEQDGANHYTGSITLPFEGDWTLEIVIEVTPGNTVLMSTPVPIR